MAEIQTLMVVGAGQIGAGIAHVAALYGFDVLLHDIDAEKISTAISSIETNLAKDPGMANETGNNPEAILARISPALSLKESVRTDFIIEAATENLAIKKQIFSSLSDYITPQTILATNTSSLSVSEIARATDSPERVIGMHFLHPASVMSLVEIVRGLKTAGETIETTISLARSLGKEPVEVTDHPGFISNRLLMPMINEAICCVFDGIATIDAVDKIMKMGLRHPMGPLQLADLIGLDTCLSVMEIMHREYDDAKYRPCPLLRNMVKAGKLGRKTGEGFYTYSN